MSGKAGKKDCNATSKRTKRPCEGRATHVSGGKLCYHHGGAPGSGGDGRPVEHALYSRHVPADWKPDYEYFKTDPRILSLESDIAVARVARARFLKNVEGAALTAEIADTILEHGIKIGKLAEIHNKIQTGERQIITFEQLGDTITRLAEIINTSFDQGGSLDEVRARINEGIAELGGQK